MEELDLKELFNMFWSRKTYIILIVLIFIIIGAIYTMMYVSPVYKSEIVLYLVKSSEGNNENITGSITTTDLTLNQKLVSTYMELVKEPKVINKVISNLNIDKTPEQVKQNISTTNETNSTEIKITVTDKQPEMAKQIADEIAKVFKEFIKENFKIDNIRIGGEATLETSPYNINHIKDIIMFSFVGIVVAVIYVLISNMLDTTVKSKEDIEKKLGVTVLTIIPVCNYSDTNLKKGKK